MAITVTREKNIISVLVEGKKTPYKFDINTGIMYGLRGNAIKTVTREVFEGICPYNNRSQVARIIYNATNGGCCSMLINVREHADTLRLADSFDNLGITIGRNWNTLEIYEKLIADKSLCKDYIKYAQEKKEAKADYSYGNFIDERKKALAKKAFDFDIDDTQYGRIQHYLYDLTDWATSREIKSFCVNFVYNNFYLTCELYECRNLLSQFKKYCEYCNFIHEKVTTKDNFLSEYGRVYKAYLAQKEKVDNERFKKAMDIHRAEMEFEYGNFKIVVPSTPQEIKDEGMCMHHCVASYAYECMKTERKNRSHIVFVRHKDTPKKCYITCEIINGKIRQYYLSHDRRITSAEDIEFKEKYQEHLDRTWKKE